MPLNKKALIRYQALDKCFRNPGRKYFMEDLIASCNVVLREQYGIKSSISRRQIFNDIKDMEERFAIPLDKKQEGRRFYYRYQDMKFSISNHPLSASEESEMREALVTISRIKGLPHFEWIEEMITRLDAGLNSSAKQNPIIQFDQNVDVKGLVHMQEIYHAISRQNNLLIRYQSFKMTEPKDFVFSPYFLKQDSCRWYVFGLELGSKLLHNFPLDRILGIAESNTPFQPTDINFDDYFEDVIGVSKDNFPETLEIKIRVDAKYYPYIVTKPLHGSQKALMKTEDHVLLQIQVVENFELQALLFSYGELLEVIEPVSLRNKLAERISKMHQAYCRVAHRVNEAPDLV